MIAPDPLPTDRSDIVVCGGGLAGLLLARQLRRECPQFSVTVVERTRRPLEASCHKVGESSVELGSQYLERLGLEQYLLERQIVKFGLRFFPGGGHLPVEHRTELGPGAEPIVRSYQLDRGIFEGDLRGFIEADGAQLIEGFRVKDIELGDGDARHRVTIECGGHRRALECRWVVDATGRTAILRGRMQLTRSSRHAASAGWFRIAGRFDINRLVPESEREWHRRPHAHERWRSTNHFMGEGYWAWVIPLSSGNTSIGLVIHDTVHDPQTIMRHDRVMDFLRAREPVLAAALEGEEVLDFLCLPQYSHSITAGWSAQRWALVGEAGAFVDPLYSPGTDFIALANSFTTHMIRTDLECGATAEQREAQASFLNIQYRGLVIGAVDLFRRAAPVYGHGRAMATKVYWDNFSYWSYTCQYSQQALYKLPLEQFVPLGNIGRRLLELGSQMQRLFCRWAELAPDTEPERVFRAVPTFPSILIDAHCALAETMTAERAAEYLALRLGQAEQIAAELVLRIAQSLSPEDALAVLDEVHFWTWGIRLDPERIALEDLGSLERRKAVGELVRDVERSLGPVVRHPDAARTRALLAERARVGAPPAERVS